MDKGHFYGDPLGNTTRVTMKNVVILFEKNMLASIIFHKYYNRAIYKIDGTGPKDKSRIRKTGSDLWVWKHYPPHPRARNIQRGLGFCFILEAKSLSRHS